MYKYTHVSQTNSPSIFHVEENDLQAVINNALGDFVTELTEANKANFLEKKDKRKIINSWSDSSLWGLIHLTVLKRGIQVLDPRPVHFHYLEFVFICQRKTTSCKNSVPWLFVHESVTKHSVTDRSIWRVHVSTLSSKLWLIGFYWAASENHSEFHITDFTW